jgi:hypothetical protein
MLSSGLRAPLVRNGASASVKVAHVTYRRRGRVVILDRRLRGFGRIAHRTNLLALLFLLDLGRERHPVPEPLHLSVHWRPHVSAARHRAA